MTPKESAAARIQEATDRQSELTIAIIEAQIEQDRRESKTLGWMVGVLGVTTAAALVFLAWTGAFDENTDTVSMGLADGVAGEPRPHNGHAGP